MTLLEFVQRFKNARNDKNGWKALCPAHEDKNQSLSITQVDNKILLYCHASCSTEDVLQKAGLTMQDLFLDENKPARGRLKTPPKEVAEYKYTDENGNYIFSVVRFEPKDFRQRTEKGWGLGGVEPVLFNLSTIKNEPIVFVVEGEKDVLTLAEIGVPATTAPMGAGKWRDSYSEYLKNKTVFILPDNDKSGREHALKIKQALGDNARIIKLPGLKNKEDATDWIKKYGGTKEKLLELTQKIEQPFDILGYTNPPHTIIYRRKDNQEIIQLGFLNHKKENLIQLAPLGYWSSFCGGEKIEPTKIMDIMAQIAHSLGKFHSEKIRGYGAWMDNGVAVYNDGESLKTHESKYYYKTDFKITDDIAPAIQPGIKDVFKSLGFNPGDQILLGGWCCIAPICGALRWRPHIWITADHGAGKSVILERIVAPVAGRCMVPASNTTEAGLRQGLAGDAIPIVFDEAEGKTKTSYENMLKILELARKSSGNTGAITYKGTPGGRAFSYIIQSAFCFASINPPITEQSDESRISILEYTRLNADEWINLEKKIHDNITPEKCSSLRNLTIKNIGNIFESIERMYSHLNKVASNARFADQYAPLLAGWWHLDHENIIDDKSIPELTDRVFAGKNMYRINRAENSDCAQCLDDIMSIGITLGGGIMEPIRSLISKYIKGKHTGDNADKKTILNVYGISVTHDYDAVIIYEKATEFRRLLQRTAWQGGVGKILSRLPGVITNHKTRIACKSYSTIKIPIELIIEKGEDE